MKKTITFVLFLVLLFSFTHTATAGGIQGRAAVKGEVVQDIRIYAYKNFDTGLKNGYIKVSDPTKVDGTYKLDLPAGKYYFIARKTKSGGMDLAEGDLYCYYSGSPIDVSDTVYKNVGFNLIRVPPQPETKQDTRAGAYGTITFEDKPLEKVYLFAYKDASTDFKGPADYFAQSANGKFKITLPEGSYYLIARKHKKGGMYGPMEKEDFFNYYHGNPVKINKNTFTGVTIECITRLDMLEDITDSASLRGVTARMKNGKGNPVNGLYLLVYTDASMKGKPKYVSEKSDASGKTFIELNLPGKYYLLVRNKLGGPASEGDYYNKYPVGDSSITLKEGEMYKEIDFEVTMLKK